MTKTAKKILFGIVLIVAAALLVLKGINPDFMKGAFDELSVWDVVWTIVLGFILIGGIVEKHLAVIIFALSFLIFIFQGKYMIPTIPAWAIFPPAALLYIGIEVLIPRKWHIYRKYENGRKTINVSYDRDHDDDDDHCDGAKAVNEDGYNIEVEFGNAVKYFEMDDFTSSNLECNFGVIKAYYDKAKMLESNASIFAEVNFGSIEIYIPKTWKCDFKKDHAFGAVKEFGEVEWDGEHTLKMDAEANFGEIRVYHV
ncbi:MAG: hypothetical protein K6G60_08770 [Lachnospiraceae bacterium]|nr:hypothetical protein [Lachnospiraceae bacterium]